MQGRMRGRMQGRMQGRMRGQRKRKQEQPLPVKSQQADPVGKRRRSLVMSDVADTQAGVCRGGALNVNILLVTSDGRLLCLSC